MIRSSSFILHHTVPYPYRTRRTENPMIRKHLGCDYKPPSLGNRPITNNQELWCAYFLGPPTCFLNPQLHLLASVLLNFFRRGKKTMSFAPTRSPHSRFIKQCSGCAEKPIDGDKCIIGIKTKHQNSTKMLKVYCKISKYEREI